MNSSLDILRRICLLASNEVLISLSLTSMRDALISLVRDNTFWYERTQLLVGKLLTTRPQADWKTIYYCVVASKTATYKYEEGMDDLNSLLVLEEIYGEIRLGHWNIWSIVGSSEVLQYLLETKHLTYNEHRIRPVIMSHVEGHNVALVEAYLDLMRDDADHNMFVECLKSSVAHLPMLKLFYERGMARDGYSDSELYQVLSLSVRYNYTEAVEFILGILQSRGQGS